MKTNVVHRGTLTEEKLQDLCRGLDQVEGRYVIERQPDGNFIGSTFKFGTIITVREVSPEYCLQRLLTHDGKTTD